MRAAPFALVAALIAAAPAMAASRHYDVPGFDRVQSNVPFDVSVHTGRHPGVTANGDQELIDRLEIGVEHGELVIRTKRTSGSWFGGNWHNAHSLHIDVTVPMVHAATLNGPGNLDIDHMKGGDVTLTLSGPGNMKIWAVEAGMLDATLSGPGDITAIGRADRARVTANGPGNVRYTKLSTRDLDVTLNGPGDVDAVASGNARLTLRGPGDIRVTGGARCQIEKHGPGDVRCG